MLSRSKTETGEDGPLAHTAAVPLVLGSVARISIFICNNVDDLAKSSLSIIGSFIVLYADDILLLHRH